MVLSVRRRVYICGCASIGIANPIDSNDASIINASINAYTFDFYNQRTFDSFALFIQLQ